MFQILKVYTICNAQNEVRIKFSLSVFRLTYFSNFFVRISETSPRRHFQADGNLYSRHREKLKIWHLLRYQPVEI